MDLDRIITTLVCLFFAGLILLVGLCGCASQTARVVENQTQGVAIKVEKAEARIVGVVKEIQRHTYEHIEAGGNVAKTVGDRISERLAIFGVVVMGLSYPIGKIAWIVGGGLCERVRNGKANARAAAKNN